MKILELHGDRLTLADVESVADASTSPTVHLADDALPRVQAARDLVEKIVAEGRVVYGINTGFGALAEVVIPHDRIRELQQNLIRSHAAGVGAPLPESETR